MSRGTFGTAVIAVVAGVLVGFLFWGAPSSRLRRQLEGAKADAVRLGQQIDDLRAQHARIASQLESERARVQAAAADLRREKEQNVRLHALVGQGRK